LDKPGAGIFFHELDLAPTDAAENDDASEKRAQLASESAAARVSLG